MPEEKSIAPLPKMEMASGDKQPTVRDVEKMYRVSKENRDRVVEWAWTEEAAGKHYRLVVNYPFVRESDWWDYEKKDDPTWYLYEDKREGNPVIWEYKSGDFELALEIVQMVCAKDSRSALARHTGPTVPPTPVYIEKPPSRQNQDICFALRSHAGSYFTGQMLVRTDCDNGAIYFVNGMLVHATTSDAKGHPAVREIVSWQQGQVMSYPGKTAQEQTISKHFEYLISEGLALIEHKRYLASCGLMLESRLVAAPIDPIHQQTLLPTENHKTIFRYFQKPHNVSSFLRDVKMPEDYWTPVVAQLLSQGLLQMTAPKAHEISALELLSTNKDEAYRQLSVLISSQTNQLKYEALISSLWRELLIYKKTSQPFSLVVLDLQAVDGAGKPGWLSAATVKIVAEKIKQLIRPTDVFAHFESLNYAVLLPSTDLEQAKIVARTLMQGLAQQPISQDPEIMLSVFCGVANIGPHGPSLSTIIDCAKYSKKIAKKQNLAIVAGQLSEIEEFKAYEAEEIRKERQKGNQFAKPAHLIALFGVNAMAQEEKERPLTLHDLLIRAGLISPEQLEQARQLMLHDKTNSMTIDRVLAMEGHIQAKTVKAAEEIFTLIGSGELTLGEGIQAVKLIANHGLDIDTALKKLGRTRSGTKNPLAVQLESSRTLPTAQIREAMRAVTGGGLPLSAVLLFTGVLTKPALYTAINEALDAKGLSANAALEELLFQCSLITEHEIIVAREAQLVNDVSTEQSLVDNGFVSQPILDLALQALSEPEATRVQDFAARLNIAAPPIVPERGLVRQTQRTMLRFCREHLVGYEDALELFGKPDRIFWFKEA